MNAFLRVTAAILPIVPYLTGAALGFGAAGAGLGLTWTLAAAWLRHRGPPPGIEIALAAGLAGAWASHVPPLGGRVPPGEAILMAALALGAAVSLVRGRPWTAAYAGGAAGTPLFTSVNAATSTVWAVLFAWLAVSSLLELSPLLRYGPLAAGGVASIALPPLLMRRGLARLTRGASHADWVPPAFSPRPTLPVAAPDAARGLGATEAVDVAIVGAGIGGLTAAALLADARLRVAVFEQHDVPGGFAHG